MTKRFILVALTSAAVLAGCGKAPVTSAPHPAANAPAPSVTLIRDTEFAQGLNDHQYDEQIAAARQAIAGELTKQGLALPEALATRHVASLFGAKVTKVTVVQGANGGTLAAGKVSGPNGSVGAIGVVGPNGGAAGVVAAKGADGSKGIVAGAKDANGNAIVAGAAKNADGGAVAGVAVKGADGGEAGKWVAKSADGTVAWGAGAKDANGNAIGGTVVTKDGKVVATRWLKGANGDALLETVTFDPRSHLLVYQLTANVNGKLTTATATVVLPG